MGRGKGGYTTIQTNYKDSGGRKVTDKGTIFVAERYIIKTSDDKDFVKDIEVKKTTTTKSSQLAKNIIEAFD